MSNQNKYERFGKYLILDHLVDGGMAKICRARYLGEQANKMVAVKMVQPQFSNDEAFVRMFQDELNITFGMLHPNIMQVYDYGKTNGQLYTAMEYIHGANLKQFLDRLKENKKTFPVEASCYIVSQVCLGLHYAHTFTDKLTGKPYNVVHRDISPHNIMLTYDGAVKVIDFGIAKANTNSEATQAGTIKGKLSYLAPEYLDGLELDCRYDEFAVGITLWEMLCSRKLFQANNDLAVLKLIQQCKIIPPSEINPTVPKELDAIVLKALSKDRSQRYENLDLMNRALVRFLYSNYPDFNPSDLRSFADELFKKEIQTDQENFVEYGKIDIVPFIEDLKREESRTGKVSKKQVGLKDKTIVREKVREIDLAIEEGSAVNLEVETIEKTATRRFQRNSLENSPDSSGETAKAGGRGTRILPSGTNRTDKTTNKSVLKKQATNAKVKKKSNNIYIFIFAASLAGVYLFKDNLLDNKTMPSERIPAADNNGNKVVSSSQKKPNLPSEQFGQIILTGLDMSMEIYLNNMRYDYTGRPIKVELNKESIITIKKLGYRNFTSSINLTEEENSKVISIPQLERARTGILSTSQNYTAGSKLIYEEDGVSIERDLPFTDVVFAEGSYQGKIVNPILGTEKKVEFSIEENKKHFLE
jgi:serine/threonine protein kinase